VGGGEEKKKSAAAEVCGRWVQWCLRSSHVLLHGALSRYVAHLLAVVALRLLVPFRAVTGQVVALTAPVAGAVGLGAVTGQVAGPVTVVALAVVKTTVLLVAVASKMAALSTAEARSGADLGAVTLDVASIVAVVASARVDILVTLLGDMAQLIALVATVNVHLALAGIVTHTVTLEAFLSTSAGATLPGKVARLATLVTTVRTHDDIPHKNSSNR